ncbi:hypothetical protein [Mangrovibacillus cuniculi]|uniref:Uncharacterized protein n=1 Tax=Mangrovibacillus cuniculi TaxID=2593652 RepID=A0A7S8HGJ7_9BACI|nr:hypothetical protein [Mangrovibacillus cuniculi]QPC47872.1 hypothetical protein G8O30_13335 [Mangrovibacillus cuniculi]
MISALILYWLLGSEADTGLSSFTDIATASIMLTGMIGLLGSPFILFAYYLVIKSYKKEYMDS